MGMQKMIDKLDMSDLRVLFIHSGSDLYGASRSLLRLSSRLTHDGATVLTVLPHRGPLYDALQAEGVEVIVQQKMAVIERKIMQSLLHAIRFPAEFILSVISLLILIKKFKPHLVHTITAVVPSSGLAAKLGGIAHIWHVRESFGEFGRWWKYYQFYMGWLSSEIICVSTPIAEQFEPILRAHKVNIINNGFPIAEFEHPSHERIQTFKAKFALEKIPVLVGVVGRIKFHRKGQEVFVNAAHLLRDRFPDTRFLCIGSPFPDNQSHLDDLLNLIHERGLENYVIYTGDVGDVKAAIAALDILVLSSAQPEPFAGVVIEAMALSRPVVATRTGGSVEQVNDGVTGYLVEPGDAKSMAAGIGKLLEDPVRRRIFGENGRVRFLEQFEFEPFYQRIIELYDRVVKKEFDYALSMFL
jgi:glycosyltransferase involved in cell wall biosynthesis